MSEVTGDNAILTPQLLEFKAGFTQAYQQSTPRLTPFFDSGSVNGEYAFVDRIGVAGDLQPDNVRFGKNPESTVGFDRRMFDYQEYDDGQPIDPKDLKRIVSDPTSDLVQAHIKSMNRKKDKVLLERIFAPVRTGKTGQTLVSFVPTNAGKITVGEQSKGHSRPISTAGEYVLTAGEYEGIDVAVDYSETGTATGAALGISLSKLKAIRKTMLRLEAIQPEDILNVFITSSQANQLLGIEEIINSDYASARALEAGEVTQFMKFRFIQSELLLGSGTSADPRQCIVAAPSAYRQIERDTKVDMWNLPDRKNIPYLYFATTLGGSRMFGENLCRMNCID